MRLTGIFIYPVKGMRGVPLQAARMEPCGLAGDRRWMVVDARGRFLTQRTHPSLARFAARVTEAGDLDLSLDTDSLTVPRPEPDAERLAVAVWHSRLHAARTTDDADRWLSDRLGMSCRLVFLDDPRARPVGDWPGAHVSFADSHPALLASEASLDALNVALLGAPGEPVGMDRFRPNLVVSGAPPWAEDGWWSLRIGALLFDAPSRCTRCQVPGIDQSSGEIRTPGEPMSSLARLNRHPEGVVFGRNLVPRGAGPLEIGDGIEIEIEEQGRW